MQTKEDVETVEGKGGLKMKIEELKTMINELELLRQDLGSMKGDRL